MPYVITSACIDIKDKSCIQECPVSCIYEGNRMLYIHPEECIDCGACEPVCPTNSIYYISDVPEKEKDFIEINKNFFNEVGSPNGSNLIDLKNLDHETVKNYKK